MAQFLLQRDWQCYSDPKVSSSSFTNVTQQNEINVTTMGSSWVSCKTFCEEYLHHTCLQMSHDIHGLSMLHPNMNIQGFKWGQRDIKERAGD
jgi:hypothetical protein